MGEVCSLLGHNGAGKTTITFILVGMYYLSLSTRYLFLVTLNILIFDRFVGMLEPTSGSVIVEGFDYRTHSQEIRKMIGFCPQYGKK